MRTLWKYGKWVLLLFVLFAGAAGFTLYRAFANNKPLVSGQLAEGVTAVSEGYVCAYVVEVGDGTAILIDAGVDPSGKAIAAALARRGLKPESVRAILFTHGHADHTAGWRAFPKAERWAEVEDVDLIEGRRNPAGALAQFRSQSTGATVDKKFQDGEVLRFGPLEVEVFQLPGHTAGSSALLARGVLFMGDAANGLKDGSIGPPPSFFSDDLEQAKRSLAELSGRLPEGAVQVIAFSHSGPLMGLEGLSALAAVK